MRSAPRTIQFAPLSHGIQAVIYLAIRADLMSHSSFTEPCGLRSGATADEIAKLQPRYCAIAQICAAIETQVTPDYIKDGHDREIPGKGDLPLVELPNAVPAAIPIEMTLILSGI